MLPQAGMKKSKQKGEATTRIAHNNHKRIRDRDVRMPGCWDAGRITMKGVERLLRGIEVWWDGGVVGCSCQNTGLKRRGSMAGPSLLPPANLWLTLLKFCSNFGLVNLFNTFIVQHKPPNNILDSVLRELTSASHFISPTPTPIHNPLQFTSVQLPCQRSFRLQHLAVPLFTSY